jgi:hypothetical protein
LREHERNKETIAQGGAQEKRLALVVKKRTCRLQRLPAWSVNAAARE